MNFNERLLQGYDLGKKVSQLHGHTRLDLIRNGKVVNRVEKDNTITGWVGNALSAGNFFNQVQADKIYPLSQWFGGCYLTDGNNDAATAMIAGDVDIVAQAGNDAYSGAYTKRGSFNSIESGSGVNNGKCFIRNVWDWTTSQGNCASGQSIASVCLTRGSLGGVSVDTVNEYDDCSEVFENAISSGAYVNIPTELQACQIVDYANEKAFAVSYDSGTITVEEYFLNTNKIHLLGGKLAVIENTATHTITQTMSKFYRMRASLSYDGNYIYLFTWDSGGAVIDECIIDIDTWTATLVSHTYNGLSLIGDLNVYTWLRDAFPMVTENGVRYLYVCTSDAKFMKLNLSNTAITEISVPVTVNKWFAGTPACLFPNGDWIKMNVTSQKKALYYHNGEFYTTRTIPANDTNYKHLTATGYGTVIRGGTGDYMDMFFPFPYVSTVNNLQTAVRKTSELTMKLTYTISEV